jgi:hypothetical protein
MDKIGSTEITGTTKGRKNTEDERTNQLITSSNTRERKMYHSLPLSENCAGPATS